MSVWHYELGNTLFSFYKNNTFHFEPRGHSLTEKGGGGDMKQFWIFLWGAQNIFPFWSEGYETFREKMMRGMKHFCLPQGGYAEVKVNNP